MSYKQHIAAKKLDAFCARAVGEEAAKRYRDFAMHCAALWIFNADMLYQMRANFGLDEQGAPITAPQEAIADLLLGTLTEALGGGWFEFDADVRELLLREFQVSPQFGRKRLLALSDFMLQYLEKRSNARGLENGVFAEMLHWNALMYVRPEEAAERIGLALREGHEQKNTYQPIRVQQIFEKIVLPVRHDKKFKSLEKYIEGAAHVALERRSEAARAFEQVESAELQFGKVTIKVPKLKPVKSRFELSSGILHACLSDDGNYVAAGLYNGQIALIDLLSGDIRYRELSQKDVNSVRIKGNKLLAACLDGQVFIFDWTKPEWEQLFYHDFKQSVWTAEFDSKGDRFLLGLADGTVEMWRLSWRDLERRISAHKRDVMEAMFDPDENFVISVGLDASINFFNVKEYLSKNHPNNGRGNWTFALHPNRCQIALGNDDGEIEVATLLHLDQKIPTFIDGFKLKAHNQSVRSMTWLAIDEYYALLSASTDGSILVHSAFGELLYTIQAAGGAQAMCLQALGDKLMTATGNTVNVLPIQGIAEAIKPQLAPNQAPKPSAADVIYREIMLYVIVNIEPETRLSNFEFVKDLLNVSRNIKPLGTDYYEIETRDFNLRLRLQAVEPDEIRYGLHRFYMPKNAVCLLVMYEQFDRLLIPEIESVTRNTVVIGANLLYNIYQQRRSDDFDLLNMLDQNLNVRQLDDVEQVVQVSTDKGAANKPGGVQKTLRQILNQAPGFGEIIPQNWMLLQDYLIEQRDKRLFVDEAEFFRICEAFDIPDGDAAMAFLHKTGRLVPVQFRSNTPYVILNSSRIINVCLGILRETKYRFPSSGFNENIDKYLAINVLIALNKALYLNETEILIPDSLPLAVPENAELEKRAYPACEFEYEILDRSIYHQLITRFSGFVADETLSQNAAVFARAKARVLVQLDLDKRSIRILIDGPGSGVFSREIGDGLTQLNEQQGAKALKYLYCPCGECSVKKYPSRFEYESLLKLKFEGEKSVVCANNRESVLIDDVLLAEPPAIRLQTLIEMLLGFSNVDEARVQELLSGKTVTERIAWIEKGLAAYRAVCKVKSVANTFGTGFLMDDGSVITCNHCINKEDVEKGASIEFEEPGRPGETFSYLLDSSRVESSPKEALNFSIIGVKDQESKPLSTWGRIPAYGIETIKAGEPVFVMRYHEARLKEIDLKPAVVLDAATDFIYYTFLEKSPGSSGGPVFNANWDCIGIHMAAIGPEGGGMEIGLTGRKEGARKGTSIKAILKPTTAEQQPEEEQSPLTAEIEYIQDLIAQSDLNGALKALTALNEKLQIGFEHDILMLRANINRTQKEYDEELLSNEDYRRIQAQNTHSVLALLNEIPEKLEQNEAAQKISGDMRRKIKK